MAALYYLIYTSQAKKLMGDSELLDLLSQSRRNNSRYQLTGMLLYMEGRFISKTEGRFIQILEGDEHNVQFIYDRICKDDRNHGMLMLECGTCTERAFPGWTMGFKSLSADQYIAHPDYFQLDQHALLHELSEKKHERLRLLRRFYTVNTEMDHL